MRHTTNLELSNQSLILCAGITTAVAALLALLLEPQFLPLTPAAALPWLPLAVVRPRVLGARTIVDGTLVILTGTLGVLAVAWWVAVAGSMISTGDTEWALLIAAGLTSAVVVGMWSRSLIWIPAATLGVGILGGLVGWMGFAVWALDCPGCSVAPSSDPLTREFMLAVYTMLGVAVLAGWGCISAASAHIARCIAVRDPA